MAVLRVLVPFLALSRAAGDTILDEDFCPIYYHGSGDCEALRRSVRVNHSRARPTLELGDPSMLAMLFFHGWPDTAALWANQFEHFCAPPHGKYFCVAPTWTNFHPDFPDAPEEELFLDVEVDKMYDLVVQMGLADLTLVIFDWGTQLGYMFTWRYPDLVRSVVAFDVGLRPVDPPGSKVRAAGDAGIAYLPEYQRNTILAFRTKNISIIEPMEEYISTIMWRGRHPKFFQTRTCWPYNCIVLNGSGEESSERLAPEVPFNEWQFMQVPSFPDGKPFLFMHGLCDDGTGCPGCPPCQKRSFKFFVPAFLDWIAARPDSAAVGVPGAGHWMMTVAAGFVNEGVESWLEEHGDGARYVV